MNRSVRISFVSLGCPKALAENGKVVVTDCMDAEPETITTAYSSVLAVTGLQQCESVLEAVRRAAPPGWNPHINFIPAHGIKLTPQYYAYLKIS